MADAYIGEIRAFAFGYVPQGWYICNGQEISAPLNAALYAIIGNTWGGTPNQTFKLPNLQGFTVMCQGQGPGLSPRHWGATTVGSKTVVLSGQQLPPHNHTMTVENPVATGIQTNTQTTPVANQSWLARVVQPTSATTYNNVAAYIANTGQSPDTMMHGASITVGGGNTAGGVDAHENRQPYLTMLFCINNDGVFPVRN
jgi:microcystin-dependent protein